MNRKYSIEEFSNVVSLLRNTYEDVILTTDIIVGFPGETEVEFSKTYEFLKNIKFYKMHVFKYSIRKGTVASEMENQIQNNIKEERSKKLIELSDKNEIYYLEQYIGKKVKVLFEDKENGYFKGHTDNYIVVKVKTEDNLENKIKEVLIKSTSDNNSLVGTL